MASLQMLITDMNQLEGDLSRFELKFGVKSKDFYAAMITGALDEFDALDDYRMDFVEWLGLYEIWQSLNSKYQQTIARQPVALQIKSNLAPAYV